jgi:hypothetical protein
MATREFYLSAFRQANPNAGYLSDDQVIDLYKQNGAVIEEPAPAQDWSNYNYVAPSVAAPVEDRGFFSNAASAFKRGIASSAQGANILQGATDAENAQDIARYEGIKRANPVSAEFSEFMQAEGFAESAKAFAKAPVRIISEVMAESLAQSVPSLALGFVGGAAGGALASAPTGGAASPVTTPLGALVGAGIGAGSGSAISEYASTMLQSMQEAGMDPTNPESIQAFFSDPERLSVAREAAVKRGLAVGVFDGISQGLAGKFVRPLRTAVGAGDNIGTGRIIGTGLKEVGMGAGLGATGEAAAQVAADGEINDFKSIFLEGIAEVGSAPFEVATNVRDLTGNRATALRDRMAAQRNEAVDRTVRQRAPLVPETVPELVVPEVAAPVVETPVAPPAAPAVVATPVLSAEQQDYLINVAGLTPDEAAIATIEEYEARVAEQEQADEDANIEAAATRQAEASRRAQEIVKQAVISRLARDGDVAESFPDEAGQGYFPGMVPSAAQRRLDAAPPVSAAAGPAPVGDVEGQTKFRFRGAKNVKIAEKPKTVGLAVDQTVKADDAVNPSVLGNLPAAPTAEQPVAPVSPVAPAPAPVEITPASNEPTAPDPVPEIPVLNFEANKPVKPPVPFTAPALRTAVSKLAPGQTNVVVLTSDGRVIPVFKSRGETPRLGVSRVGVVPAGVVNEAGAKEFGVSVNTFRQLYKNPKNAAWAKFREESMGLTVEEFEAKNPGVTVTGIAELSQPVKSGVYQTDRKLSDLSPAPAKAAPVKAAFKFDSDIAERLVSANSDAPEMIGSLLRMVDSAGKPTKKAVEGLDKLVRSQGLKGEITDDIRTSVRNELKNALARLDQADFSGESIATEGSAIAEGLTLRSETPVIESFVTKADPALFGNTVTSLTKYGAFVKMNEDREALGVDGSYNRKTQLVTSLLRNAAAPSRYEFRILLHEATHFVSQTAPAAVRNAAHRAVEIVTGEGIARNANANPEEQLAESIAQQGVDRAVATNLAASIWRTVKDWLLKTTMLLQEKVLGADNVSGALARAWVENRVTSFMGGDVSRLESFLAQFGVKPTLNKAVALYAAKDGVRLVNYGPDGVPVFRPATPDTVDAIKHNIEMPFVLAKAELAQAGVLDAIKLESQQPTVPEVRDEQSRLLAPNGRVSKLTERQWRVVRTPEFKAWFGDWENDPANASKVTNPETGEPMVVYHGTNADFTEFSYSAEKNFPGERNTTGTFFFTTDSKLAANYADRQGGNLIPAFLNVVNPFVQKRTGEFLDDLDEPTRNALETMGRVPAQGLSFLMNDVTSVPENTDGLVVRISNEDPSFVLRPQDVVAVFNPAQIKSAIGNNGNFDPANPNILQSQTPADVAQQRLGVAAKLAVQNAKLASAVNGDYSKLTKLLVREVSKLNPAVKGSKAAGDAVPKTIDAEWVRRALGLRNAEENQTVAMKQLEAALSTETEENVAGLLPEDLTVDHPSLNESERVLAEKTFYKMVRSSIDKMEARYAKNTEFLAGKDKAVEENKAEIQKIVGALNDPREQHRMAMRHIMTEAQSLTKDIRSLVKAGAKESHAQAILAELADQEFYDTGFTQKVLDSMNLGEALSLEPVMRSLFQLEAAGAISLSDSTPQTIRQAVLDEVTRNSDSPLASLVTYQGSRIRGTALLSAVLGFVKSDALLSDSMRLRIMKNEQTSAQQLALIDAFENSTDTRIAEISAAAKGALKQPGNRAIAALVEKLNDLKREQSAIANARLENQAIEYARPVMNQVLVAATDRLGIGANTKDFVYVPEPGMTGADLNNTRIRYTEITSRERASEIRTRLNNWLGDYTRSGKIPNDEFYSIQDMLSNLKMFENDNIRQSRLSVLSRFQNNLVNDLREIGTASSQALARIVSQNEGIKRANTANTTRFGRPSDNAKAALVEAANIEPAQADVLFDQLVAVSNLLPGADQKEALAEGRRALMSDERFAFIAKDDTLWALASKWKRLSDEGNAWIAGLMDELGFRVQDTELGNDPRFAKNKEPDANDARLRKQIERGGYKGSTYAIGYNAALTTAANVMDDVRRKALLGDGGVVGRLSEARKALSNEETRAAALATDISEIDALFDDKLIREVFLDPLFKNLKPSIPQPAREDGLRVKLDPTNARAAWAQSNGSVLTFADKVAEQFGLVPEQASEYRMEIAAWVVKKMNRVILDNAQDTSAGMVKVESGNNFASTNRVEDDDPPEWTTFRQTGEEDLLQTVHDIAEVASFGRSKARVAVLAQKIDDELNAAKTEYERLEKTGGLEALKRKDPKAFADLETKKLLRVNRWKQGGVLNAITMETDPQSGSTGNLPVLWDLFSLATVALLSGPKTALRDMSSIMRPVIAERSASLSTLGTVKDAAVFTGKSMMLSAFKAMTGVNLQQNDWRVKLKERALGEDPAKHASIVKTLKGEGSYGINNRFMNTPYGRMFHRRVVLPAKDILVNTPLGPFARKGPGVVPRLNAYVWATQAQREGLLFAYMDRALDLAVAGAEYYKQNPDKLGSPLKNSPLGKRGEFKTLSDSLQQSGFNLEDMAAKLARQPDMRPEALFTNEDVVALNNFILDEMMLEAGPNTRPRYLREGKTSRLVGTLIGWSFGATDKYLGVMRDRESNAFTPATVVRGAALTALAMMPMAVAFSLLVDWYDEEVSKKKTNWRELDGSPEDLLRAAIDRTAQLGAPGLLGEVANKVFNGDEGAGQKWLSLDQRIVFVNMAISSVNALTKLAQVGFDDANYADVYRPLFASLGGNGMLQYAQAIDGLLELDKPAFSGEASISMRSNMNTWLSIAAKEIGIPTARRGGMSETIDEVTPHATNMYLAALRRDTAEFRKSYQRAVKAAQENFPMKDPIKLVAERYASKSPLRRYSDDVVPLMLAEMPEEARAAVTQGIQLYNQYGAALGLKPSLGAKLERSAPAQQRAVGRALGIGGQPTASEIAAALAARRNNQ